MVPAGVEECWVTVEGIRIRYLRAGSGPPLLLVHGLMGYSFSWTENFSALAPHFTVYAPDLPNLGYSGRARTDSSLQGIAGFLLRFMDALGLTKADVIGTSHGGALVMMMGALAPERISRMVLVAPAHPFSEDGRKMIMLLASPLGKALGPLLRYLPFIHGFCVRRVYGDPARALPGTAEGYSKPLAIPGTVTHLLGLVRQWESDFAELRTLLPKIAHIPMLLVWGTADIVVEYETAAALRRQFPHAGLRVIECAGHLPYEEFPEEFNRIVVEYLALQSEPVSAETGQQ